VISWLIPSSAISCVTVEGVEFGNDFVTDTCDPMSRLLMVVRCALVRPFMMIWMFPNQNAGTSRIRNSASRAASARVARSVITTGVSCVPYSATDSETIPCAYSIVVARLPAVGAAGAIATFTVFTTEGFSGVNWLGREAVGATKESSSVPAAPIVWLVTANGISCSQCQKL